MAAPSSIPVSSILLLSMLLIPTGCKTRPPAATSPAIEPTTLAASPRIILSGNVAAPGPKPLADGQTVADVIAANFSKNGKPAAIVLVRQGPEGKTRELIQVDPNGKLMDEKQDYLLRDNDELVFPGPILTSQPDK
jgi:hypothetical protein